MHHVDPDAVWDGDYSGQHSDDAQTSEGGGACRYHNQKFGALFSGGRVYTKTIKLLYTGDKWGCDEKYQKVRVYLGHLDHHPSLREES